jgi:hypothetical protein
MRNKYFRMSPPLTEAIGSLSIIMGLKISSRSQGEAERTTWTLTMTKCPRSLEGIATTPRKVSINGLNYKNTKSGIKIKSIETKSIKSF